MCVYCNEATPDYVVRNGETESEIIIETDTGLVIDRKKHTDKVRGAFPFSMPEAIKIRDSLFPGMTLEYLFATTDTKAS